MGRLPYMQLWGGDFISSTTHLSLEQRGGYLVIMLAMWNAGGMLPNDPVKLARICGVSLKRWSHISPEILEFFEQDGDRLSQKRLTAEYQKQSEIIEKKSAAGKLGNLAKSLKSHSTVSADATAKSDQRERISSPSPSPSSNSEEEKGRDISTLPMDLAKSTNFDALFQQWYDAYPKKVDPKDALKAFTRVLKNREATFDQLLLGAQQYASETAAAGTAKNFIKAPAVWLNKGSWMNEAGANATAPRPRSTADSAIEGLMSNLAESDFY